jgi:SAM-dependent methyltransferase
VSSEPHSLAFDPVRLREAATRRWYRRSVVTGQLTLPAVPGMLDEYVAMCAKLFATVGRAFTDEEVEHVREVLADQLAIAYAESTRSTIVINYEAAVGSVLNYEVKAEWWTMAGAYENWIGTREPPLFGADPDALVWTLSSEAADPTTHPVLDIGAGTGRNALALARRGHPVDAVEMTPKFADVIRADAEREALRVHVIEGDVFAGVDDLRRDYQLIVLSGVVSDFRTPQQLRGIFVLANDCLAPGGRLVFNAFLTHPPYVPDDAALELGQQCYTSIFTREELRAAASGLPLRWVSDDSVCSYEQSHLPEGGWPPTSWYADWASGLDVFDVPREESPIELRWLVYQKLFEPPPLTP